MKWLSDHKVNIQMINWVCPGKIVLWAEMKLGDITYVFQDIIKTEKVQQYLRSVVYRFKRIFKRYEYNKANNWT